MKLQVNCLLCNEHLSFAIPCLISFMLRAIDDIELHIFDDGTLTESDFELLNDSFDDLIIHKFHEYYDEVSESLSKYPTCLNYRKESPFALKFLDLPLCSKNVFVNLDSDIYFFKTFKDLNRSSLDDPDYVGSRDIVSRCYGLSFRERYFNKKISKLPDQLNAGFIYMNRRIYDLDHVEWLLKKIHEVKKSEYPRLTEQFVIAGLVSNKNSFIWDREQIKLQNPNSEAKVKDSTIAIHFYHRVRSKLLPIIENENLNTIDKNEAAVPLLLEPVTYHSVLRFAFERVVEKYVLGL